MLPFSIPADVRRGLWLIVAVLGGLVAVTALAEEDEDPAGFIEYEIACMPCHGVDGKTKGPDAGDLAPADLTQIAARNGGVFPFAHVVEIIDGRAEVASHGPRGMPVWGNRYRVPADKADGAGDVERRAEDLINSLAVYLESIQGN